MSWAARRIRKRAARWESALLERFRGLGAFTLASTHLMAMKVYGASTAGVLNGSMGFDEQTLEPTYVLRLGAPGKSAGLDIARRLGLDESLIGEARARMTTAEQDVSRFLAEMHQKMAARRAGARRGGGAREDGGGSGAVGRTGVGAQVLGQTAGSGAARL